MRGAKQKEMFEISDLGKGRSFILDPSVRLWVGGGGGKGVLSDIFIHTRYIGSGYFWGLKL